MDDEDMIELVDEANKKRPIIVGTIPARRFWRRDLKQALDACYEESYRPCSAQEIMATRTESCRDDPIWHESFATTVIQLTYPAGNRHDVAWVDSEDGLRYCADHLDSIVRGAVPLPVEGLEYRRRVAAEYMRQFGGRRVCNLAQALHHPMVLGMLHKPQEYLAAYFAYMPVQKKPKKGEKEELIESKLFVVTHVDIAQQPMARVCYLGSVGLGATADYSKAGATLLGLPKLSSTGE